jgi:hypothetical protein
MNLAKFHRTAMAASAIFAVTSAAWAGCNCNVPPSPAGLPMSGSSWNAPGPAMGTEMYGQVPFGSGGYDAMPQPYGGVVATNGPHWAPGGYEARVGSPAYYHDPSGGQFSVTGDPYYDHFGPGFQRHSLHGHYRFPYYNYRAPWYFPGRAVYNRNTNFAW